MSPSNQTQTTAAAHLGKMVMTHVHGDTLRKQPRWQPRCGLVRRVHPRRLDVGVRKHGAQRHGRRGYSSGSKGRAKLRLLAPGGESVWLRLGLGVGLCVIGFSRHYGPLAFAAQLSAPAKRKSAESPASANNEGMEATRVRACKAATVRRPRASALKTRAPRGMRLRVVSARGCGLQGRPAAAASDLVHGPVQRDSPEADGMGATASEGRPLVVPHWNTTGRPS